MAATAEELVKESKSYTLPFLREVYLGAGINVDRQEHWYHQRNWEREARVARRLVEALQDGRESWPVITVDDPLQLIEGIEVSLQDTELWSVTERLVKPTTLRDIYKDRALARLAFHRGPLQYSLGRVTAEGGANWWDITQLQLATVRGEQTVSLGPGRRDDSDLPEVVSFLGMLGQYLERL